MNTIPFEEEHDFLLDEVPPSGLSEDEIYEATVAQHYVDRKGVRCLNPACRSTDISEGESWEDGGEIVREVACDVCGSTWSDIYRLVGVQDIKLASQQAGSPASQDEGFFEDDEDE